MYKFPCICGILLVQIWWTATLLPWSRGCGYIGGVNRLMGWLKSQRTDHSTAIGWGLGGLRPGRLKMREWKMRHGHNCRGWKMQEWKMREQTAGVENVGVSPMYSLANLRINWDGVKLIQICYLTYEIHIIRQYNLGVTLDENTYCHVQGVTFYAFSFLVRLIWHM